MAFARFERLGHAFDAGGIALRGRSADIGVHDGVALKSKAVGANFSSCALGMHELNIGVTPPSSRTSRSFLFRQAAPGEEDLSFRSCEHAMGPTKAPPKSSVILVRPRPLSRWRRCDASHVGDAGSSHRLLRQVLRPWFLLTGARGAHGDLAPMRFTPCLSTCHAVGDPPYCQRGLRRVDQRERSQRVKFGFATLVTRPRTQHGYHGPL